MLKKYMNSAIFYAVLAMIFGVFYREFTKFNGYTGETVLSLIHTHYFVLGMVFFLLLVVFEKLFSFSSKNTGKIVWGYHIGLNLTVAMFLMRGIVQIKVAEPSRGLDASISGMAGLGHIIISICMILILFGIKKAIVVKE